MVGLQERLPAEVPAAGAHRAAQLPLLLPLRGRLRHRSHRGRRTPQVVPLEGRQRTQRATRHLQTFGPVLHPLHAVVRQHHAGGAALLLRRLDEADNAGERSGSAQPDQHRVLPRAALQGGRPAVDPVQRGLEQVPFSEAPQQRAGLHGKPCRTGVSDGAQRGSGVLTH